MNKGSYVLSLSGMQFKMCQKIANKLERAGATTIETAVTIEEAEFDLQEIQWLSYFAGGFLSRIKKTKDQQFYV